MTKTKKVLDALRASGPGSCPKRSICKPSRSVRDCLSSSNRAGLEGRGASAITGACFVCTRLTRTMSRARKNPAALRVYRYNIRTRQKQLILSMLQDYGLPIEEIHNGQYNSAWLTLKPGQGRPTLLRPTVGTLPAPYRTRTGQPTNKEPRQ